MIAETARTNKIVKVKAKIFTIRVLRQILINYIQEGEYGWELIKDDLSETVFKVPNYIDGEYGYLGIKYDEIRVGSTYRNWLFRPENLRNKIAYNSKCANASLVNRVECGASDVTIYNGDYNPVKDNWNGIGNKRPFLFPDGPMVYGWNTYTRYQITKAEIFHKNANVLFFTMFKQYENGIEWDERMGNQRDGTAPQRISYRRSTGDYFNGITHTDTNPSYWDDPPLYPGVGCPAIGSAPGWFAANDKGEEYVIVYLSRTKHNVFVAINFQDYWDMAQFGFFIPFDTLQEYPFPAFVMSSNNGARPIVTMENDRQGEPYPYPHMIYDYTQDNISLGHSMPCYTASYWNGTADFLQKHGSSSMQAMTPKGQWKSMINWGFRSDYYYNKQVGFWESFKEPERVNTKYFNTVYHSDVYKSMDPMPKLNGITYIDWNIDNVFDYIENENTTYINTQPILMSTVDVQNDDQNLLGIVPATYWCSSVVNRHGLYKKDDNYWLVVPNVKKGRRWHRNAYYSVFLGKTQTSEYMESERERIDELSNYMNSVFSLGKNIGVEKFEV